MSKLLTLLFAALIGAVAVPTSASARVSFFIGLNYTYAPYPQYGGGYHGRQYGGVWYCPANTVDAFYDASGRLVCIVSPPPAVVPRPRARVVWAAKTPVPAEDSACKGKTAGHVFVCPESPTGKCICQ